MLSVFDALFDSSRTSTGRVVDGWMLLIEIKNDCYLAIRESDPHPRQVYFIHVTEEDDGELDSKGSAEIASGLTT